MTKMNITIQMCVSTNQKTASLGRLFFFFFFFSDDCFWVYFFSFSLFFYLFFFAPLPAKRRPKIAKRRPKIAPSHCEMERQGVKTNTSGSNMCLLDDICWVTESQTDCRCHLQAPPTRGLPDVL